MSESCPSYCVMIPHYRHVPQLIQWLPELAEQDIDVLLIDDGSGANVTADLIQLCRDYARIELILLPANGGKGSASIAGMNAASERGFSHVISMDADGQHALADLDHFIEASRGNPTALISGAPQFSDDIPASRLHGRKITNTLVQIEAGQGSLIDAMCGYRLYPLRETLPLLPLLGPRLYMQFDVELLVRAAWASMPVVYVPTPVCYPDQGRSHFRLLTDNILLTAMHIRLLLQAPFRVARRLFNERRNTPATTRQGNN